MLSDADLYRYSRQLLLSEFDLEGQERIAQARVLLVGAGGLGSPAALYLAGAGVGELVVADPDHVDLSNLHRQVAYRERDVGRSKVLALADQLRDLNPTVRITPLDQAADRELLAQWLPQVDLVLDCSDNFPTRLQLNAACVTHRRPLISGAAIRLDGHLAGFDLRDPQAGCYQCLYGDGDSPDLHCSQAGILGPVVGSIGTLQALMALRLLTGHAVTGVLHRLDGRTLGWRQSRFGKDPGCPCCGTAKA